MVAFKSKKRIFVGLISIGLLMLFSLLLFSWHLFFKGTEAYQKVVLYALVLLFFVIILILGFGVMGLVVSLWQERNMPPFLQKTMLFAVSILFPVALMIGKIFRIDQEIIKSSFIEVNNQLVRCKKLTIPPEKILILAPHCLQKSDCMYKITVDSNNCIRCGRCSIEKLHGIAEKYGVNFVVASGGTFARKFIKQHKPMAVIAIACERDLTSGIQDSKQLPVMGVLNIRPEGPCFNTNVDMNEVEKAIAFFLK